MAFEHYIRSGQKMLRLGYTSGTCAALAAAGATYLLLGGYVPEYLTVKTGKGIDVTVEPEDYSIEADYTKCGITKDGGDDVDVTNGLRIYAKAEKCMYPGIFIDGGEGIGKVTKPGLDQPPGNSAINSVPRKMIAESVQKTIDEFRYKGGIRITIYAPGGEKIAKKTFNPMLGIVGGISILGTSGIVEPMSTQALVDTIEVELKQHRETSDRVILTPGNYGENYIKEARIDQYGIPIVRISNFLGDAIDIATTLKYKEILLISHIGKMSKVAAGVMQTHSKYADCRNEVFCSQAAIAGADTKTCKLLMDAATTDRSLEILESVGLKETVMESMIHKVQSVISRRAGEEVKIGAITFSNVYGFLAMTDVAKEMDRQWAKADIIA